MLDGSNPAWNQQVVQGLWDCMAGGQSALENFPGLVRRILEDGMWRRRYIEALEEEVELESFVEFITARPLRGCGSTVEQFEDLCQRDPEALRMLREATTRGQGNPTGNNQHGKREEEGNGDNVTVSSSGPERGNAKAYTLTRLYTEHPDLYSEVLAGNLSAHRAAVQAGIRKPTWTAPADLDDLARALARRYPSDAIIQALLRLEADPVAELQQSLDQN